MVKDESELGSKKAEKRARSEAMRLESMKQKRELEKQREFERKRLVKEASSEATNKRIVFSDSDAGSDDDTFVKHPNNNAPTTSKKAKLFDESSEEEEEEDTIKFSGRHEGKKGEKLAQMESRFNNDSRFKLDDKFASSGSEDEEEGEQSEFAQEKQKNRDLLSKVLGKTVKARVTEKSKTVAGRPFTRFDPENPEHVAWVREQKEAKAANDKKAKGSKKNDEEEEDSEEKNEEGETEEERRVDGQYYQMDSSFAEELKKTLAAKKEDGVAAATSSRPTGEGFSFLAMMGRKTTDEDRANRRPAPDYTLEQDIAKPSKMARLVFNNDSDDEPDQTVTVGKSSGKDKKLLQPSALPFFLTGNEPFVKSVVANFKRTQSLEKIAVTWSTYRDSISKLYKHERKVALKRLRENPQYYSKNNASSTGAKTNGTSSTVAKKNQKVKITGDRKRKRKDSVDNE